MPRDEAAALLGVPVDAVPRDVQRAHLLAARRTHPDVLPEADEAGRRAAGAAFARLTSARDVLIADRPPGPRQAAEWVARPGDEAGPRFRRVPGRRLGGSLVVLALLAFLLIALVSVEQAYAGPSFDGPGTSTAP
jgi:curved DNA-binding protein CbpA